MYHKIKFFLENDHFVPLTTFTLPQKLHLYKYYMTVPSYQDCKMECH